MAEKSNGDAKKPESEKILEDKITKGLNSSSQLPLLGSGYELYSINSKYGAVNKNFRNRLFNLIQTLLASGGYSLSAHTRLDDISELSKSTDFLLDRCATDLDAHENSETIYNVQIPDTDGNVKDANETCLNVTGGRYSDLLNKSKTDEIIEKRTITKPQLQFKDSIVNEDAQFVPKLRIKHHDSKKKSGMTLSSNDNNREWLSDLDSNQQHPYQSEILNFKVPSNQLTLSQPTQFKELNEIPLTLVDTEDALKKLIATLNKVEEFAVDLEHHDYRTFLGLTCLMQISTRTNDYIIDPFPIWDKMYSLNEPFTNPKILKVFHGADSDIIWLQRDFGIYVVNMLDTYIFMRLLEKPKRSLQALVSMYCNVQLEKSYQLADWRLRPLDDDYIKYARSDTHYLLYCCDKLKQLVQENNKLDLIGIYNACKEICLQRFEQPRFNPDGYSSILGKSRRSLNNRQLKALQSLWKWRDQTARMEDESYQFVLPDHMLYHICEVLPREIQGIMACCSPVPPLVKRDVFLIHRFIKEARDLPLEQKTNIFDTELGEAALLEAVRSHQHKLNQYTKEFSRLDCRFDQSEIKVDDNRPQIETRFKQLFEENLQMIAGTSINSTPILPFKSIMPRQKVIKKSSIANKITKKLRAWATPYDSYLVEIAEKQIEEPPKKRMKSEHKTTS